MGRPELSKGDIVPHSLTCGVSLCRRLFPVGAAIRLSAPGENSAVRALPLCPSWQTHFCRNDRTCCLSRVRRRMDLCFASARIPMPALPCRAKLYLAGAASHFTVRLRNQPLPDARPGTRHVHLRRSYLTKGSQWNVRAFRRLVRKFRS